MPLTKDTGIHARTTGRLVPLRVAADAVLFLGAIAAVNAQGYGVPAADAAGLRVIGVAQEQVSNQGGGDGARWVRVKKGVFGLPNSTSNPVTQAHVGRTVYIEDDGTVASAGGVNSIEAGVVEELGDDGLVYVHFA